MSMTANAARPGGVFEYQNLPHLAAFQGTSPWRSAVSVSSDPGRTGVDLNRQVLNILHAW
jgi:hypothetical protein